MNKNLYPTLDQINSLFQHFDERDKTARENMNARAENYYNCVDDYSFGGLCDKAASEGILKRNYQRRLLKEQTGVQTETFDLALLCDLDGNIVSKRIVKGKFGYCWILGSEENVKFVGVSKKQSTYNKKGYHVKTQRIVINFFYLASLDSKDDLKFECEIISNEIIDQLPEIQQTFLPKTFYYAIQKD